MLVKADQFVTRSAIQDYGLICIDVNYRVTIMVQTWRKILKIYFESFTNVISIKPLISFWQNSKFFYSVLITIDHTVI